MRVVVPALVFAAFGAGLLLDTGAALRLGWTIVWEIPFPARLAALALVAALALSAAGRTTLTRRFAIGRSQPGSAGGRIPGGARGQRRKKAGKARHRGGHTVARGRAGRRGAT